ncbi:MAG: hypothetical protein ABIN89_21720 [Chitinophagaceae bacterium]
MQFFICFAVSPWKFNLSFFDKCDIKPGATEICMPVPKIVGPGAAVVTPSNIMILFDDKNLNIWLTLKDDAFRKYMTKQRLSTVTYY